MKNLQQALIATAVLFLIQASLWGQPDPTGVLQGFQLDATNYSVWQDSGVVRIGIERVTDETNAAVTVDFATADLTATNGVDYVGLTNTLTFGPGENSKRVDIWLLSHGVGGPTKNFGVRLLNPTAGAVLGAPASAVVWVTNSNPGITFEQGYYLVWENAGSATVTVLRGSTVASNRISVDYSCSDMTARAGVDYQARSGTLVFAENETVKTITVPILRNPANTNNSSFLVTLSHPDGGAWLGPSNTMVYIFDATGLGTFQAVAPPFDTALAIRQENGVEVLTWAGGGQLERADRPAGPWRIIPGAQSPYAAAPGYSSSCYRVGLPRPVQVYLPSSYDGKEPMPLVLLLHAYSWNGTGEESYLRLEPLAEARGFLYCHPEGTVDQAGNRFWNATDACCDFLGTGVDDAGYLRGLIEEICRRFTVDRKRIFLVGHSNGGFMAYRMACDSADLIAGIASLAGATYLAAAGCQPSEPVSILEIHATGDQTIWYNGGTMQALAGLALPPYPGARETTQRWADYNGADGTVTDSAPSMDLDLATPGLDTVITRYTDCPPGGAVELWTIEGGSHVPTLYTGTASSEFSARVVDWLLAHPKP